MKEGRKMHEGRKRTEGRIGTYMKVPTTPIPKPVHAVKQEW
jgi:hypothetical protein